MRLVADLHIHSHYSRATSKDLTFEHLSKWAQFKGVQVLGTGDIAHPGWLQEMHEKLEPAEAGLFRLKPAYAAAVQADILPACQGSVRFMLAGEISNIYKKGDKTRKVHNVVFAPTLAAVERLQARLEKIGNIRSDGRPILGLDSRDLLEIILEVDERCHLIPAHIWTPWFSMLGSMSGFDSVEECFDDLTPHIFALETGLSSDPSMNWRVSNLDRFTLVSNSDAHSPPKLAREATLFDTDLSYDALFAALRTGDPATFKGTIEFFPEEGKYHLDGHRKCGVCWEPAITLANQSRCTVCGKPVTVGVMHRVEKLADRDEGGRPVRVHPFHSLVPLPEVLGELHGVGPSSKRVTQEYFRLLGRLGPELTILLDTPIEAVEAAGGLTLAQGIDRMRRGQVLAIGGYDGEFGVVKLFSGAAAEAADPQITLIEVEEIEGVKTPSTDPPGPARILASPQPVQPTPGREEPNPQQSLLLPEAAPRKQDFGLFAGLNAEQRQAALCTDTSLVIVAGPGTGKTRTLTVRIAQLIRILGAAPTSVLAITFTNKAADEMADRLTVLLGGETASLVTVKTFHAFGAQILRESAADAGIPGDFTILREADRLRLMRQAGPELDDRQLDAASAWISAAKNQLLGPDDEDLSSALRAEGWLSDIYNRYEQALHSAQALDVDDLLYRTVQLLEHRPRTLNTIQERYRWISVDEYQDVNHAQYRLLRLLVAGGANLCAIGDPDQAIYGFRGADHRYFLRFQADFPDARVLRLDQNYRSSQRILDAAMQVIGRNPDRAAVQLWSNFVDEVKLDIYQAPTDRAEAEYVVHQIEQMVGGTSYFSLDSGRVTGDAPPIMRGFGDFAVLFRLGAQSRVLVAAFERSGIPFHAVGQTSLYDQQPAREIVNCLWLLHNPSSAVHLDTLLSGGAGPVAAETIRAIQAAVEAHDGNLATALEVVAARSQLGERQRKRLSALADLWRALGQGPAARTVTAQIDQIWAVISAAASSAPDATAQERVQRLRLRSIPFGTDLAAFLEASVLQREADTYDPRADRVALMTLHAAKGLEFPVVFVVGCEETLLPYLRPGEAANVDEERRLFYVGLTRAREKLILTHARRRFLFGQSVSNEPSPFLDDIESALKEIKMAEPPRQRPDCDTNVQLSLF